MFELCRITPHGYRLALEGKDYGDKDLACEENGGKQWDILCRILANGQLANPPPAAQAICGGTALDPEEDYGGPRVLSPDQVAEISQALEAITPDDIEARYHALDFTGAYGAEGRSPSRDVARYQHAFERVRAFYADTAAGGNAILWYLG